MLPDISANVSYQTNGVGGDQLTPITSFTGTIERAFGGGGHAATARCSATC